MTSQGKDQNSKFEVSFLLNEYCFHISIKMKNCRLNHCKLGAAIYFGYQPLIKYMICKYFLPFSKCTFHLFVCLFVCFFRFPLLCRSFLVFDVVSGVYFCICCVFFQSQKNHCQDLCQGVYCLCFLLGVYGFRSVLHTSLLFSVNYL